MASNVIIKPIVTEKSTKGHSSKLGRYAFRVERDANKISIKKAVEDTYNVKVDSVNTEVTVGKKKTRQTRRGVSTGLKAPYKKAYVTLKEGEAIDFYGSV